MQLSSPHSYRGYCTDLAFENKEYQTATVKETLKLCQDCVGTTFESYKGGDYKMEKDTLVWVAFWGETGFQLLDIDKDGGLILKQELIYINFLNILCFIGQYTIIFIDENKTATKQTCLLN